MAQFIISDSSKVNSFLGEISASELDDTILGLIMLKNLGVSEQLQAFEVATNTHKNNTGELNATDTTLYLIQSSTSHSQHYIVYQGNHFRKVFPLKRLQEEEIIANFEKLIEIFNEATSDKLEILERTAKRQFLTREIEFYKNYTF